MSFHSEQYVAELTEQFRTNSNPAKAVPMQQYMKNRFPFLGISAPERMAIIKNHIKQHGLPPCNQLMDVIRICHAKPEREYHYFAVELSGRYAKKAGSDYVGVMEYLITQNSWWDTVDYVSSVACRPFFKEHVTLQHPVSRKWMDSGNIWLQRSALLFQLNYKSETNTDILFGYIRELASSKEFFIAKAIGWSLREYAKTDKKSVELFLKSVALQPLSVREATKHIGIKKRR